MRNFYQWMQLSESVTFTISNVGRQPPKDLHELSYPLAHKIAEQFPDLWKKIGLPEIITPDGDDFEADRGVMNFYAKNLTEEESQRILKAIIYYVKELGAQVISPPKKEESRLWKGTPVFRITIQMQEQNRLERPPEINLANGRAFELLKMLGYKPDYAGTIDVRDLLMRISKLGDFEKQMTTVAPSVTKGPTGPTMYDGGISHEQIDRYLEQLEKMARWAIQRGFDSISFA